MTLWDGFQFAVGHFMFDLLFAVALLIVVLIFAAGFNFYTAWSLRKRYRRPVR